jgi:BirA family biotin operon repressor/biotin-[acetyl-CoA-carboxylase] ligase
MEINDFTLPSLSAFAAVALAEALGELGFIDAKIKAPNDLYLEGRKVAGILIETRPGKNPFAVVGIGLNVNQHRDDFPPELQDRATSLAIATGRVFDRNEIAVPVLRCLGRKERQIRENPTAILASWNSLLIDPAAVVQAPA